MSTIILSSLLSEKAKNNSSAFSNESYDNILAIRIFSKYFIFQLTTDPENLLSRHHFTQKCFA